MRKRRSTEWLFAVGVGLMLTCTPEAGAQADDELYVGDLPLQNAIVNRDIAVRLRAEIQLSEDNDEVIEDDPNYARFPTRLYSTEAKLFMSDRSAFKMSYMIWENDQNLLSRDVLTDLRVPLSVMDIYASTPSLSFLSLKFRHRETQGTDETFDYAYLGWDKTFGNGWYTFLHYRLGRNSIGDVSHQGYEYVTYKPTERLRLGELAAITKTEGSEDVGPWYVRLFASFFLIEDKTSVRLDGRYYESPPDFAFQDYNAYLYHKLGARSFVRLNYRYYADNDDLSSHAYGAKFKHYLSPRTAGHVGYRFYDHSEGTDFDTAYAGVQLLF